MEPRSAAKLAMAATACAIGMFCSAAHASTAWQGELRDVHLMQNGVVLVYTTGSRTTPPTCSTVAARFAFDSTTAGGKSQLAGILAAHAAGRQVVIVGTDNCSVYGDSETISYSYIVG
jgi:hypothetical protein